MWFISARSILRASDRSTYWTKVTRQFARHTYSIICNYGVRQTRQQWTPEMGREQPPATTIIQTSALINQTLTLTLRRIQRRRWKRKRQRNMPSFSFESLFAQLHSTTEICLHVLSGLSEVVDTIDIAKHTLWWLSVIARTRFVMIFYGWRSRAAATEPMLAMLRMHRLRSQFDCYK